MRMAETYKHWRMEIDADHILWLTMDRAGTPVNSLDREVFDELSQVLVEITERRPAAVILLSGKKKGFIAGADIKQFTGLQTSQEAFDLIRQAQQVLDQLAALPMPTVAMISGFCLGGGYEVALACRYRVAEDSEATHIGLPEVKLGIHPGWGGTVRLPRLIGAPQAMGIMLAGKALPARKAALLGMIDVAVPLRELKRAARYYALQHPKPHRPHGLAKYSNARWIRPWLGSVFYKKISKKVNAQHYPAPYAIIRNWIKSGVSGKAMLTEAESIARLLVTEQSRNLVRVFFLQSQLKSLAKRRDNEWHHVHVVGAGTMGGDIAARCALKGMYVTLQDQSPQKLAPAVRRAHALYQEHLTEPRLVQAAMDRLQPDEKGDGAAKADIIIEAIFEDLVEKRALFQQLESRAKPEAILATNTSSIPLDEINIALNQPERLVGLHFFNPVAKMMLVEVVRGQRTSSEVVQRALAFVGMIDRLPLPVKSSPGFLINRILMPYLLEAMVLLEEKVSVTAIDQAAVQFGMPMGPIALADRVGLDICLSVAKNMVAYFGGHIPQQLQHKVHVGQVGVKSGEGFYVYHQGKPIPPVEGRSLLTIAEINDRLILRMLNECMACWYEKIIDEKDLLDAGMVFGTGFAPFRGGPLHYAQQRGVTEVVQTLQRLAVQYGDRFKPHIGWQQFQK